MLNYGKTRLGKTDFLPSHFETSEKSKSKLVGFAVSNSANGGSELIFDYHSATTNIHLSFRKFYVHLIKLMKQ